MTAEAHNHTSVHFGPTNVAATPLSAIHELHQVRTTYSSEGIAELATAIAPSSSGTTFNLQNPLTVAQLNRLQAHRYINDHADFYQLDDTVRAQHLDAMAAKSAFILIAGHRRKRAITRLIREHDIAPEEATIATNVLKGISFDEALGMQLRENTHERPPLDDEARAIERQFHYMTSKGNKPTPKEIANLFGFSETKVRDALAFASLPQEVQALTQHKVFSFTTVRQLKPLFDIYTTSYGNTIDATDAIMADVARILRGQLQGSDDSVRAYISARLQDLQPATETEQEAFFELAVAPRATRSQEEKKLAQTAFRTVAYHLQTTSVNPSIDDLSALRDTIDRLIEQKAAQEPHLPNEQ